MLRPLEHVQVDAVLQAAGGAVPLDLDVDRRPDVGGDAVEANEGRVPDGGGDGRQGTGIAAPVGAHSAGSTSLAIRSTCSGW